MKILGADCGIAGAERVSAGRCGMTIELRREPVHSPFGGSVASRVLHCPASVGLVEKVPAHLRRTSAYAERGTALHAAMMLLIDSFDGNDLDSLIGTTIGSYTITRDDVDNALAPVFAYVDTLIAPGAEFYVE